MNLIERAKGLLQKPKDEWPKIERETEDLGTLFWGYAAPLAVIPPAAAYAGLAFTSYAGYRINPALGLVRAMVVYLLLLAGVKALAVVLNALATTFGAQKNAANAMKIAIFAPTPFWLAGIFAVQPPLAFLSLLGLYSFYLLYTGIAALMKAPAEKVLAYTIVASVLVIVLWVAVAAAVLVAIGSPTFA